MEESIIDQTSCILHSGKLCDEATVSISSMERCQNIKEKSLLWSGIDKFRNVHATVDKNAYKLEQ